MKTQNDEISKRKILIIGGGFAGVRTALDLAKKNRDHFEILLVSDRDYLLYYPSMFQVVSHETSAHMYIPLVDIFANTSVQLVQDRIVDFDIANKSALGSSGAMYTGDYLVMALGSQMNYFNIEGVGDISYNFTNRADANSLKSRVSDMFAKHHACGKEELLVALHFIIVGGGPSGVEFAGELAQHTRKLAVHYDLPESLITIDLVERNERLLAKLPKKASDEVAKRLRVLGVNLLLNRALVKSKSWTTFLSDMTLGAKTVVWTAGTKPVEDSQFIEGFEYSKRGKIQVDSYLQAVNYQNVFVLGDNADTSFSGLAQTAIHHGQFVAKVIKADLLGKVRPVYHPRTNSFAIPVGRGWAVLVHRGYVLAGQAAWLLRHMIDFRFYKSILSFKQAWRLVWRGSVRDLPPLVSSHENISDNK